MARRKSLKSPRNIAFAKQGGRCYYCGQPMWRNDPQELLAAYRIRAKQARWLQCTGEHLTALSEGGSNAASNIVAACKFCNLQRHRMKRPKDPDNYRLYVERRLRDGKWLAPLRNHTRSGTPAGRERTAAGPT